MRSTCANPAPIWKPKPAAKARALPATVHGCWPLPSAPGCPLWPNTARSSPATAFPTVRRCSVFLPTLLPECTTGVLTVEVSRLTRGDLMDQGRIMNTFKYSGTKIITPEHTYDLSEDWDEDVLQSDLMMARREYKYIKKRMQRGRQASASEGLWQGRVPYGYRKIKVRPGKGYTLEPDPEQAPIVQMIFDMYAREKIGCATIAQRLNALGLRTNTDHLWTNSSVMCISKNPVYAGYVTWGKRTSVTRMNADGTLSTSRVANAASILAPGKHPALIDQATFDVAQNVRASHDLTRCHASVPFATHSPDWSIAPSVARRWCARITATRAARSMICSNAPRPAV